MAYTVTLTDGSIFSSIPDGTLNTASSMILVGKNYAGYGEFLDQNFIRLLESSACNATSSSSFSPTLISAPVIGQLWWNKTNGVLCVFTGDTWKNVGAVRTGTTAPTFAVAGDLWFDITNQQLKVFNGTSFILVGPASTSGQGTSGAIVTTVQDNLGTPGGHVIIQFFVQDTIVGIVSKDATFTPSPAISGFATIGPGLQLSTAVSNNTFRGTATNSELLQSLSASQFLRSDQNDTTTGTLGVLNDSGFTVGADQDARISVTTATSEVTLQNQTNAGNLSLRVNISGTPTNAMLVNGSSGVITFPVSPVGSSAVIASGNIAAPNFIGNLIGNFSGTIVSPGLNTQVLFNDGGQIAGNAGLTFNKTTSVLGVSGNISSTGSVTLAGGLAVNSTGATGAVITNSGPNTVGNIGSTGSYFNTVHAVRFLGEASTAVSATTAGTVSGTVAIANGGTGQTTKESALNALLPTQTGAVSNYFLRTDGAGNITWQSAAGGGSVTSVGFTTSLNGLAVAGSPITGSGSFTLSGTLGVASGGTGKTSFAAGSILRGSGTSAPVELVGSTSGQVLQWSGTEWIAGSAAAGVTAVTAASPLASSGGSSPQISLTGTVSVANGGTGATSASDARNNLGVPSTSGSGASGTWNISISGSAASASTATSATTATRFSTTSGSAPAYAARAWVNFNGSNSSASIQGSQNISSISYGGVAGFFQVNFSTSMSSSNYAVQVTPGIGLGQIAISGRCDQRSTSNFFSSTVDQSGTAAWANAVMCVIHL